MRTARTIAFALGCSAIVIAHASVKLGTNASLPFQYGVDSSGNSYVLANLTLNSGLIGLVITKLNSSGKAIYTARLGTNPATGPYTFTLDSAGNTYTVVKMTSLSGVTGLYLVKVNAAGSTVYSVRLGTSPTTSPFYTNVDSTGNVTVVVNLTPVTGAAGLYAFRISASGATTYSVRLGSSPSSTTFASSVDSSGNCYTIANMLNTSGVTGLYMCKVSPAGSVTYSTKLGTSPTNGPFGTTLDGSGSSFTVSNLTPISGSSGLYLDRIASSGSLSFATKIGTNPSSNNFAANLDASDNTYLIANYTPLTGTSGLWASKYDSTGKAIYANRLGNNVSAAPFGYTIDSSLNAYAVSNMTNSNGLAGLYVTKMSSSGTVTYSNRIGTSPASGPFDAHLDTSGNVFTLSSMLAGTNAGLWSVKVGTTGNTIFSTRLGYSPASLPFSDAYDSTNNLFAVVNMTSLTGSSGLYSLKVSNSGLPVFTTRLGINPASTPFASYFDGYGNSFVMANMSGVNNPTGLYVARVNGTGNTIYNFRIGTNPSAGLTKYILDGAGNAFITSNMTPIGGSTGLYVTKVDPNGNVIF